jgi:hypothetical protein
MILTASTFVPLIYSGETLRFSKDGTFFSVIKKESVTESFSPRCLINKLR